MSQIEYSKSITLQGDRKPYINIPSSLLISNNDKELPVLIYLLFFKGINNRVYISLQQVITYYGFNTNKTETVHQFKNALLNLLEQQYILFDKEELQQKINKCFEVYVEPDVFTEKLDNEYYATLYYDELLKIIQHKKDNRFNISSVLGTYCYLKMIIPKRSNELPLSCESFSIEEYQKKIPEAYNCYIYDIANEIKITPYAVSRAVNILKDIDLIDYRIVQRWKNDNKWKRQHIIFALFEKREKGLLLNQGHNYSDREINNKYNLLVKKKIIKSTQKGSESVCK